MGLFSASTTTPSLVGKINEYYIYLPTGYDSNLSYPFLVFLHGSGESGNDIEDVLIHGPLKASNQALVATKGMIVVHPQDANGGGFSDLMIKEFIDEIKSLYNVNSRKLYLTGLSSGAWSVWGAMKTYGNELITAIVPISGANTNSDWGIAKDIPYWYFQNDEDQVVNQAYWAPGNLSSYLAVDHNPGFWGARYTIWAGTSHDVWSKVYNTNGGGALSSEPIYVDNYQYPNTPAPNDDIYDWMLQFTRVFGGNIISESSVFGVLNQELPLGTYNKIVGVNLWRYNGDTTLPYWNDFDEFGDTVRQISANLIDFDEELSGITLDVTEIWQSSYVNGSGDAYGDFVQYCKTRSWPASTNNSKLKLGGFTPNEQVHLQTIWQGGWSYQNGIVGVKYNGVSVWEGDGGDPLEIRAHIGLAITADENGEVEIEHYTSGNVTMSLWAFISKSDFTIEENSISADITSTSTISANLADLAQVGYMEADITSSSSISAELTDASTPGYMVASLTSSSSVTGDIGNDVDVGYIAASLVSSSTISSNISQYRNIEADVISSSEVSAFLSNSTPLLVDAYGVKTLIIL